MGTMFLEDAEGQDAGVVGGGEGAGPVAGGKFVPTGMGWRLLGLGGECERRQEEEDEFLHMGYFLANLMSIDVTWKQFRAGFFSPGTMTRKGPVPAGRGLPSIWSARMTTLS